MGTYYIEVSISVKQQLATLAANPGHHWMHYNTLKVILPLLSKYYENRELLTLQYATMGSEKEHSIWSGETLASFESWHACKWELGGL